LTQKALIFANGDTGDGPMTRRALDEANHAFVVAADGGARVARYFERKIDMVIGDMDSLSAAELDELRANGADVRQHPQEKNETDLELAIQLVRQNGATWVRILGGLGGRLDQTLSNIYLLALPELKNCDARLVAGAQQAWLIYPGENLIQGNKGDTVSLIPLSGSAGGVRTENLYYPLRDETLVFGPARGVSNVMMNENAHVWLREGLLLVVHTMGRA
jgi:thiamine pyrophosphokinase